MAVTICRWLLEPPACDHEWLIVQGASGTHKLVIHVLGTAGHPRIDIDAFIVLAKS